ncbi:MAG: radical SAM protein [Ignavibacteriales bacterium]|nr:radical SAM protein [Ignavibacteriales bacterium]
MDIDLLSQLTGFSKTDLTEAIAGDKILGLGLELTRQCNLKCVYCYANSGKPLKNELTYEELLKTVDEATLLGVKKIGIIGGGEPLLYENLKNLINYIFQRGISISLFTNGVLIDKEWASFLYDKGVSIVHKLNSFDKKVQDKLCGVKGSFEQIQNSLNILMGIGYPTANHKLSIETVILKENISELPSIWRWARNNKIIPVVERLTPFGRSTKLLNKCSTEDIKNLFEKLSKIDMEEFNIKWLPHPPFAGTRGCYHHYYALYITSNGEIQPCSGVTVSLGNIRTRKISDALRSRTITELRHIGESIKGKCKICEYANVCYGCRGSAYHVKGSYLASDPQCWIS